MSSASYSDLVAAVSSWLGGRTDLNDRIPDFIALAEAKFNRDLAVRQMEQRSATTIDITSPSPEFISLPADFRSMRWLRVSSVSGKPHLDYLSPIALDEFRSARGDVAGQPRVFTLLASDIEICPTPDQNYTLEMVYRRTLPGLSANNQTNWLIAMAPDLYLYATLMEAAVYTQDDERLPVWGAGYKAAVDGLNNLNRSSGFNAGPLTIRSTGITP